MKTEQQAAADRAAALRLKIKAEAARDKGPTISATMEDVADAILPLGYYSQDDSRLPFWSIRPTPDCIPGCARVADGCQVLIFFLTGFQWINVRRSELAFLSA